MIRPRLYYICTRAADSAVTRTTARLDHFRGLPASGSKLEPARSRGHYPLIPCHRNVLVRRWSTAIPKPQRPNPRRRPATARSRPAATGPVLYPTRTQLGQRPETDRASGLCRFL